MIKRRERTFVERRRCAIIRASRHTAITVVRNYYYTRVRHFHRVSSGTLTYVRYVRGRLKVKKDFSTVGPRNKVERESSVNIHETLRVHDGVDGSDLARRYHIRHENDARLFRYVGATEKTAEFRNKRLRVSYERARIKRFGRSTVFACEISYFPCKYSGNVSRKTRFEPTANCSGEINKKPKRRSKRL